MTEIATLAGGCFWCLEAAFQQLKGVSNVTSGYAGGTAPNPTYEAVCSGRTGHAEVTQVEFDPAVISYRIAQLEATHVWDDPIVTEIVPLTAFYPAEAYHRDYYSRNQNQAYCRAVIAPKVAKLRSRFLEHLKR